MKYYSEDETKELRLKFEGEVLSWPKVSKKTMFGCPSYTIKNKLFAFLVTKGIVITSLSQSDRDKLFIKYQSKPFIAGKRTIRKWSMVSVNNLRKMDEILPFVKRSYDSALKN